MRLEKPLFDKLLAGLKGAPGVVHAKGAKLFAGKMGTPYEPFEETKMDGHVRVHAPYRIYATIDGKTLPIDPSIILSMLDFSECEATCHVSSQKFIPRECTFAIAKRTIDGIIDKPLEVLAKQSEGEDGIRPKWQIWLLREGEGAGVLHDYVAQVLTKD